MTSPLMSPLRRAIAGLTPAYFSMVMATGIVSIAADLLQMKPVAWTLLAVNIAAYLVLIVLNAVRLGLDARLVFADLTDQSRGPGFFTWVAGTCVMGSQLLIVAGTAAVAEALWYLGIGLWVLIMYGFFLAVTVREQKPSLETGINGAWLIATVATQSVSVLGTLLAPRFSDPELVFFFTLCMYLLGCMLYLTIITLIFYRFTFIKLRTAELTPPYWINMGAVAITTLAGSILLLNASRWSFLEEITPFLRGFTLFFWVTGAWWIPLLFILGVWKHLYRRQPLVYDSQYWGMVFPLGMFTTCTIRLSDALRIEFLRVIPRYFIFVALIAWLATFAGLVHSILRKKRGPRDFSRI